MACEKGYLEVVQKLVEAKADVNLCDEVSDAIPCLYNYCSRMQLQCRFALQLHEVYIIIICTSARIYFRISLKSGQMHCGKFQEGANPNPKGGNPILNIGKANCQGGGGANQSQEGVKAPPHPPEINPVC